jgi:hypothetical protein
MPALWTPPNQPSTLQQDSGVFYRDKNAVRFPSHPWEPTARAIIESRPHGGDVDIVCCGSTLGNLLRFVRGVDRPFQFLVDVVGGAVHFIRRENKPDEVIQDVRGYGHTFPDAYTTWPAAVVGSVSHQRIVRYMFAGLAVMLRFEADGYIDAEERLQVSSKSSVDDITALLESSLGPASQALPKVKAPLEVRHGGVVIPQDKVFDVKTRGLWRKETVRLLEDELPRLWVSQTPNLIMAYHQNGQFPNEQIEVRDVREDLARFERENAKELSALAVLVRSIVACAREHKKIEVTRDAEGATLEFREQVDGSGVAFSDDVRSRWHVWLGGDRPSVADNSNNADDAGGEVLPKGGAIGNLPAVTSIDDLDWDDDEDFSKCSMGCGYCGLAAAHA